jgi:hypothetical protein
MNPSVTLPENSTSPSRVIRTRIPCDTGARGIWIIEGSAVERPSRFFQRRSDSRLIPCSAHQAKLVFPLALHAATKVRHSSTLRCRCKPVVFRSPIDDLLDSLITSPRIVALNPSHKVRFV